MIDKTVNMKVTIILPILLALFSVGIVGVWNLGDKFLSDLICLIYTVRNGYIGKYNIKTQPST